MKHIWEELAILEVKTIQLCLFLDTTKKSLLKMGMLETK